MTWHRDGTVDVTNGSPTITGTATGWVGAVSIGDAMHLPDGKVYEITDVVSNTSVTVTPAYLGATAAAQGYAIQPTRGIVQQFNTSATALLAAVQAHVDGALAGKFGDGAAGTPGIAFASDTDTGLFRSGPNALGAATGGTLRWLLDSTAMQIDVPITGAAVQQDLLDTVAGRLMKVGAFGLGSTALSSLSGDVFQNSATGFTYARTVAAGGATDTPFDGNFHVLKLQRDDQFQAALAVHQFSGTPRAFVGVVHSGTQGGWGELWHNLNTTVDGSGFILEASPIVRLFNDRTEEPATPVGATMTRLGSGHYTLSGTPPLATVGWRVRLPHDQDGNATLRIETPFWQGGDLHIMVTSPDRIPTDIPDEDFILLRFWEAREDGEAAPDITEISLSAMADKQAAMRTAAIKADCGRRINRIADQNARDTLAARAAIGLLDANDLTTYRAGIEWTDATVLACRAMAADPGVDWQDEANWPAVPGGVAELADRF